MSLASRHRRVAEGTLANVLGQILNVGGQLALVPILLSFWGNRRYGEWLTLSAAVAYLLTFDLGMQTYMVNRLNQCYALKRMDAFTRVLHSGLTLNLLVPTAALMIVLPLIALAPVNQWLQLTVTSRSTAAWILALLSTQALYSITYGQLAGIYRTINEYPRGQMVSNVRYLTILALTVIIVPLGGGLVAVSAIQLIVLTAAGLFVWHDIRRRYPEISVGLSQSDLRFALSFLAPSSVFLGIQLIGAVAVQGSTLFVNQIFGATAVVTFVTLRALSNLIRQVAATIQQAVWPEFTSLDAREQKDLLQQMHLLTAKLVMLITTCATVFLLFMGERTLALWTQHRVAYDSQLMLALLLFASSQMQWLTSAILLSACNRQNAVFICTAIASVPGFVLGYGLARHFGLPGFVYGLAIADALACGVTLPWKACRLIGESVLRFFSEVTLRHVLLLAVTYTATAFIQPLLLQSARSPIEQIIATGLVVGVLGCSGAYLFLLNRVERHHLKSILSKYFQRGSA